MTDTNALSPCPHLESCPWCGCALYAVWRRANPRASCKTEGCFGRKMAVVNLDDPSDVAAWNCRAPAPASQPVATPAGMEPVATVLFSSTGWRTLVDALASLEDGTKLYTAAQVQAMLAAVPRNAPLYSPDDVAFPVQRSADETDAPLSPELTSIAKRASTAAVEVAAPIAPAREPLTNEQIDEIHLANSDAYERGDVEYEFYGFVRAIERHHGITAAQKGGKHGTE